MQWSESRTPAWKAVCWGTDCTCRQEERGLAEKARLRGPVGEEPRMRQDRGRCEQKATIGEAKPLGGEGQS